MGRVHQAAVFVAAVGGMVACAAMTSRTASAQQQPARPAPATAGTAAQPAAAAQAVRLLRNRSPSGYRRSPPRLGAKPVDPVLSVGPPDRPRLPPVHAWAYQLGDIRPATVGACPVDLAVIDYSADGSVARAFTREDLDRMRAQPGGPRRIIAYLSVGEAESHRDLYWKQQWVSARGARPKWLGPANDEGWGDNYRVRYWDKDWQAILLGSPQSYLDRLIAAGFDGVYLDGVAGYEFWQDEERSPEVAAVRARAADEMVELVARIARHAWSKSPGFLIVPQNGHGLLQSPLFRQHISAIGMEDIFFRWVSHEADVDDAEPQQASATREMLEALTLAQDDRIPVLAVEYLMDQPEDRRLVPQVERNMRAKGLVPHFAGRQLGVLYCPQPTVAEQPASPQPVPSEPVPAGPTPQPPVPPAPSPVPPAPRVDEPTAPAPAPPGPQSPVPAPVPEPPAPAPPPQPGEPSPSPPSQPQPPEASPAPSTPTPADKGPWQRMWDAVTGWIGSLWN